MELQNADLDRQTLSICISLIENGVNPEALAVCHGTLTVGEEANVHSLLSRS